MAARSRKPGGAGSKKKRGIAEGGTPEEKLSSALQTLAATRADLNRAELRAVRAEGALVTSREELAEQAKRAEAAEIMTRRIREEQSTALRDQLTRYDDKLKALAKSATEGHEQAMRLFEERAALLKRLEATEAQRDNLQHMADAERNLREKLEELQKQASERLDDFIAKSKPLIEENKRLATANASLNDKAVALQERLKGAAEQQAESLKLLTESRVAIHRMEQARKSEADGRRKLLKRVEKAEGMATDALKEAVGDKKELARLLRRERQLTQLADLMQARVADLEKQRDDALAGSAAAGPSAAGSAVEGSASGGRAADGAAAGDDSGEAGGAAVDSDAIARANGAADDDCAADPAVAAASAEDDASVSQADAVTATDAATDAAAVDAAASVEPA